MLALLAALCPQLIYSLSLPVWTQIAGGTGALVQYAVGAAGMQTTLSVHEQRLPDGVLVDYHVFMASPNFSISIGSFCSGVEGVFLFYFLLCFFMLLDWRFFARVRQLWEVFLLIVPLVLCLNVRRISAFFLYADWYARQHDTLAASSLSVKTFHNNAGVLLYAAAFLMILPWVYRWAREEASQTT